MATQEENKVKRHNWKEYLNLGPVFGYWFRKHNPNRPTSFNLKMMHGINKISMIMFLICLIVIIVRRFFS